MTVRFNVLRDGVIIAEGVSKTTANQRIREGKDADRISEQYGNYEKIIITAPLAGDDETPLTNAEIEDALPPFLKLTKEERAAAWAANPPKQVQPAMTAPKDESPADRAVREKLEAEMADKRVRKTAARIDKMKAVKDEGKPLPGMRWDPRICEYVKDGVPETKESIVAKKVKAKAAKKKPAKAAKRTVAKAKAVKAKTTNGTGERKRGAKLLLIGEMLQRKGGCTQDQLRKATGRKDVSVKMQAAKLGLTVEKKVIDGVIHYFA